MRDWFRSVALALGLALAAPVAGCASLAARVGNEQLATYDEKALLTAEIAYDGVLTTLQAANAAGAITPERARVILPLLQRAQAALQAARRAYDANQQAEAALATGDAISAVGAVVDALVEFGILRRS